MALLDPADHGSAAPRTSPSEAPTRHPMLCLAGGFGFIVAAALLVHLIFNAVV